jgi:tetratricopeptide (TPR) repeat protein
MGLYEDAVKLFRRILDAVPSDPLEARFLLGEALFRMGDLDQAIQEFERAGDDPDACFNLGLAWFYKGEFAKSVGAFRRGIFENVHLAAKLAEAEPPSSIPSWRGTHPKELDTEDAALEYHDRCGDLWAGRPILRQWLLGVWQHPVVRADLKAHLQQVESLSDARLDPGDVARIEGMNAALRSPERLARTDAAVARDVMPQVFRTP